MSSGIISYDKFNIICRLCGEESSDLVTLFLRKNKHKRLKDSIRKYLSIKISPGDGLPNQICGPCIAKLDETADFIEKCLNTQTLLLKTLEESRLTSAVMNIAIKREPTEDNSHSFIPENLDEVELRDVQKSLEEANFNHIETRAMLNTNLCIENNFSTEAATQDKSLPEVRLSKIEIIDTNKPIENTKEITVGASTRIAESDPLILSNDKIDNKLSLQKRPKKSMKKPYKCPECNQSYSKRRSLKVHIKRVHQDSMERCPECNKIFRSRYLWKTHVLIHAKEKPNTCDICNKSFRNLRLLLLHKEKHEIPLEQRYKFSCEVCFKKFTSKAGIQTHMKLHTEGSRFICDQCGKSYRTKGNLQVHYRIHTGEKPYECEVCGKRYANVKPFKVHQQKHKNSKPFECPQCSKGFYSTQAVKRHILIHSDTRPYPCNFCGKSFRDQWKRKVHERIHTGERPYKCHWCPSAFYESGNLQKHCKNVHNQDYRLPALEQQQQQQQEQQQQQQQLQQQYIPDNESYSSYNKIEDKEEEDDEEDDEEEGNEFHLSNPFLGHSIFSTSVEMLQSSDFPV